MSPGMETYDHSPKASSPGSNSAISTGSRSDRSEPPKRLRYWLIDMINSGEIPGLQWINSTQTVFRIPWKHAGKNNWKEEDCKIFQAWAEHRGKYKIGDKIEAATWKTRLRCALNKLPDIKELKEQSYLEGNEPYRVYQLLPEPDKAQDAEIYPRNQWGKESSPSNRFNSSPNPYVSSGRNSDFMQQQHPYHHQQQQMNMRFSPGAPSPPHHQQQQMNIRYSPGTPSPPQNVIPNPSVPLTSTPPMPMPMLPTTEFNRLKVDEKHRAFQKNGYALNKLDIIPPDANVDARPTLMRNPSSEIYEDYYPGSRAHQNVIAPHSGNVSSTGSSPANTGQLMDMDAFTYTTPMLGMPPADVPNELPFPEVPPQLYEMEIYVRYRGHTVIAEHVTNKLGCRIHYGDTSLQLIAMAAHELPSGVFGSDSLRQIGLVDCERYALSEKQVALTKQVLETIQRGLILQYENNCFYANRLCQSRVFTTGPESVSDTPERLERKTKVKVFDNNKFVAQLQKYVSEGRMKTPEIELKASFGQNWSVKTPIEKNLVTFSMVPRAARYLVQKIREKHGPLFSLNDSLHSMCGPDSYDEIAELATKQSGKGVNDFVQQMANSDPDFISMVKPMAEPPVTSGQTNTYTPQNYFQQNSFRPDPILPPHSVQGDVEMTAGYYNDAPYCRESRR